MKVKLIHIETEASLDSDFSRNASLMYRCHCDQCNVPKKSQLSLFKRSNTQNVQITRPVGRPSRSSTEGETRKRKHPSATTVSGVQYDKIAHWSEFWEAKNKSRLCKTGTGCVYCKNVTFTCLCLSNAQISFYDFNQK